MTDREEEVKGAAKVMKGYAKRLAGELAGRPDLVVEGEKEQTSALHEIRRARDAGSEGEL